MAEIRITCPNCGKRITLSEALTHQIEEEIQDRLEVTENEKFKNRIDEETAKLQEKMRLDQEKIESDLGERYSLELIDLRNQIQEKDDLIKTFRDKELELRKKQRELEEKQRLQELEVTRLVDEKSKDLEQKISERITAANMLKEAEKDQQLKSLRDQIENLKRKADQGSQQTQGEAAELKLEDLLNCEFPDDIIEPVGKGIKGADILQKVYSHSGNLCGTIVWEIKNTKRWSDSWLGKLRDDMRSVKSDVAILVTAIMPKELNHFGQKEGVWLTEFLFAVGLASVLRAGIIEVSNAKQASIGKDEKVENLYNYLSGLEFRQRVETTVESFIELKDDLEQEKEQWNKSGQSGRGKYTAVSEGLQECMVI